MKHQFDSDSDVYDNRTQNDSLIVEIASSGAMTSGDWLVRI